MLQGTVFGFQVINNSTSLAPSAPSRTIKANNLQHILEEKLIEELQHNMLSIIQEPVSCNHWIFCIPNCLLPTYTAGDQSPWSRGGWTTQHDSTKTFFSLAIGHVYVENGWVYTTVVQIISPSVKQVHYVAYVNQYVVTRPWRTRWGREHGASGLHWRNISIFYFADWWIGYI